MGFIESVTRFLFYLNNAILTGCNLFAIKYGKQIKVFMCFPCIYENRLSY